MKKTTRGVYYSDKTVGTGATLTTSTAVTIDYTLYLREAQIIGQQFHPTCRLLHLHQILQVRRPLLLEPPVQKLAEALQDCQRRLELVRGHCQEYIFGGHGLHQFACARLNHLLQ